MNKLFTFFLIFLLLPVSANAQTSMYNSDFCDFYAEFPDQVELSRKCVPSNDNKTEICGEIIRFVKNFNNGSSIDVKLSCNKIDKETYDRFSKDEILFTLESLIRANDKIKNYGMSYSDFMVSKRAYSLASGEVGLSQMINILYLWVGENSLMSMDAKLIGKGSDEADNFFAEITKSVKNKALDVPTIDENIIMEDEKDDTTKNDKSSE